MLAAKSAPNADMRDRWRSARFSLARPHCGVAVGLQVVQQAGLAGMLLLAKRRESLPASQGVGRRRWLRCFSTPPLSPKVPYIKNVLIPYSLRALMRFFRAPGTLPYETKIVTQGPLLWNKANAWPRPGLFVERLDLYLGSPSWPAGTWPCWAAKHGAARVSKRT